MKIQKGNPYSASLVFTDKDSNPYDLTDKTVFFTIKLASDVADNDDGALVTKDITTHTGAASGITVLELTEEQISVLDFSKREGYYKADFRLYASGVVQANTDTFYPEIVSIVTQRKS
jgi:hypothetical protein